MAAPRPIGTALRNLLPYLRFYFRNPVGAAQELTARRDMGLAVVLLCIQIIVGGLLLFAFVGAYLNNLLIILLLPMFISIWPLIGDSLDSLGNVDVDLGGVPEMVEIKLYASFPVSLLFGALAAAAAIAVFVVIAFAVSRISGSNCSFRDVLAVSAAHTPIVTALLLLSFLFFLFFAPLGAVFLALAVLAWMMLAIPALQTLIPGAPRSKFLICTIAGVLAALLIGGWAVYAIGSAAVGPATIEVNKRAYTVEEMRVRLGKAADAAADKIGEMREKIESMTAEARKLLTLIDDYNLDIIALIDLLSLLM